MGNATRMAKAVTFTFTHRDGHVTTRTTKSMPYVAVLVIEYDDDLAKDCVLSWHLTTEAAKPSARQRDWITKAGGRIVSSTSITSK